MAEKKNNAPSRPPADKRTVPVDEFISYYENKIKELKEVKSKCGLTADF